MRTLVTAAALVLTLASQVRGQESVKIGLIMPLTGNAASAGQQSKAAVELAAEIVNHAHPELAALPLAASAGLSNLKGAKLEIVTADSQGNPSVGQNQALRLITQEQVIAIEGAYQSSVTLASTAVAERYGIPWVIGDSVAANIKRCTNAGRPPHCKWSGRISGVFGQKLGRKYSRILVCVISRRYSVISHLVVRHVK